MSKKFKYECDGGSIMLGNETSRVCLPNGYGDGRFTVEVKTREEKEYPNDMRWLGTVEGDNIHIYEYDCLHGDDLVDKSNILYTLPDGRYGVYSNNGYVLLEQWN